MRVLERGSEYTLHVGGMKFLGTDGRQWQMMFAKMATAIFQGHILCQNFATPYEEVESIFALV